MKHYLVQITFFKFGLVIKVLQGEKISVFFVLAH